jgi:hypothetical protein
VSDKKMKVRGDLSSIDLKKIESVFGFELYDWQKQYLKGEPVSFPKGRGNGKTFAAILRILLADENTFTLSEVKRSCKTNRARIYADMLLDINAKLLAAGFITNLKFRR